MTSCDTKLLGHSYIFGEKYLMSVTDDIGQTRCSLEQYLVVINVFFLVFTAWTDDVIAC